MERLKTRTAAATVAGDLATVALPAAARTYYAINGQPAPSDEQGSNGWSHYDTMSGMWVGGDDNGCYCAGDWSTC